MYNKVSGVWKEIDSVWTKVSGTWKEIITGYEKVAGEWKLIFASRTDGPLYGCGFISYRINIGTEKSPNYQYYIANGVGTGNKGYGNDENIGSYLYEDSFVSCGGRAWKVAIVGYRASIYLDIDGNMYGSGRDIPPSGVAGIWEKVFGNGGNVYNTYTKLNDKKWKDICSMNLYNLASTYGRTLALDADGYAWVCGDYYTDGSQSTATFTQLNNTIKFEKIWGNEFTIFGITGSGDLYGMGRNYYTSYPEDISFIKDTTEPYYTDFVKSTDVKVKKIAGEEHGSTMAFISADDDLYVVGYNQGVDYGAIGLDTDVAASTWTKLDLDYKVKDIAMGFYGLMVISEDGKLYGTGAQTAYLGEDPPVHRFTLTLMDDSQEWAQISKRSYTSCLVTEDGALYGLGLGGAQFGSYLPATALTPTRAGTIYCEKAEIHRNLWFIIKKE